MQLAEGGSSMRIQRNNQCEAIQSPCDAQRGRPIKRVEVRDGRESVVGCALRHSQRPPSASGSQSYLRYGPLNRPRLLGTAQARAPNGGVALHCRRKPLDARRLERPQTVIDMLYPPTKQLRGFSLPLPSANWALALPKTISLPQAPQLMLHE